MNEVERIRLDVFRQLKKEIRGSKEHLIVGIDVAKEKHNAFFGTARGKTLLKRLVFENNIEGFQRLLTYVEAVKVKHGLERGVFGLEPTANYHKPLGEGENLGVRPSFFTLENFVSKMNLPPASCGVS
jgi:transposase